MRGGRSDGGSTRNAGAGCAGRATGRTGLSRSGAEWSEDAAAPHAETGRWSATAQGGAAECSGAERKPGRVGGVKIEPEVVPVEPAQPGRPEAEQRSTAEAEAGAGRHGCCGASAPILSLRRVGGSERSLGLAAAKAGAANVISFSCGAQWRAICGSGARPEQPESRPCGQGSQGQRRLRRKGGAGSRLPGRERRKARRSICPGADAARRRGAGGAPAEGGRGRAG